jgi:predicted MFS family arabinose efflux permease
MASVSTRNRSTAAALEQRSVRIVFFITGFGMAAWAPLVPFAKGRLGISEAGLGLLLLCLGVGSIVTMPLAGAAAARVGSRLIIVASGLLLCLTLPPLAAVSSLPILVAVLLSVRSTLP